MLDPAWNVLSAHAEMTHTKLPVHSTINEGHSVFCEKSRHVTITGGNFEMQRTRWCVKDQSLTSQCHFSFHVSKTRVMGSINKNHHFLDLVAMVIYFCLNVALYCMCSCSVHHRTTLKYKRKVFKNYSLHSFILLLLSAGHPASFALQCPFPCFLPWPLQCLLLPYTQQH